MESFFACVEITSIGEYSNGSTFPVSQISSAQPLCFSDLAGLRLLESEPVNPLYLANNQLNAKGGK
ncbi:21945_t:CDS:2, partial [Racocetra persica]